MSSKKNSFPKKNTEKQQMAAVNLRSLALDGLLLVEKEDTYSHLVLRQLLDKHDYLQQQEKAFLTRLFEGTLEQQIRLDYVINAYAKTPVKKMKPLIRVLLRMSVYQILFMDAVPDSAACNEAVKLAEKRKFFPLKGFINGILRTIVRKKNSLPMPDPDTEHSLWLSVEYSMPEWIVRKWENELGKEDTRKVLEALIKERPLTIRFRESLSDEKMVALRDQLKEMGWEARKSELLPRAAYLENTEGMGGVPAFRDGLLTVQDESSMLAVLCAGIKPGDHVVDVCAAPGGKMLFASELAGEGGSVLARDVSSYKTDLMEESRERMRAENVTIQVHDATQRDIGLTGQADVVLADVPCSGLGVIGRKTDIKYHVSEEKIKALAMLQREILTTVQHYVKPGGVLLFSTCTISRQENEENLSWFLQSFPFHLDSLVPFIPKQIADRHQDTVQKGYLQLLPGVDETDGFFIARLIRNKEKEV